MSESWFLNAVDVGDLPLLLLVHAGAMLYMQSLSDEQAVQGKEESHLPT